MAKYSDVCVSLYLDFRCNIFYNKNLNLINFFPKLHLNGLLHLQHTLTHKHTLKKAQDLLFMILFINPKTLRKEIPTIFKYLSI